jgi:hypothetical protein
MLGKLRNGLPEFYKAFHIRKDIPLMEISDMNSRKKLWLSILKRTFLLGVVAHTAVIPSTGEAEAEDLKL